MKKIIFLFAIIFTLSLSAQTQRQTMQWQDVERTYKVLTPANYNQEESLPMLVFLHGLRDNIDNNNEIYQRIADEFHWIVLLPQALEASVNLMGTIIDLGAMWNAELTVSLGPLTVSPNSNVDDAGFIMALTDTIISKYNIETENIFMSGFSMGGFMTHRMATEYYEKFKAFAPSSGMMPKSLENVIVPQPVKILHIHGTSDSVVSYDGTTSVVEGMPNLSVGLSVEQTINFWTNTNGVNNPPIIDSLEDRKDDGLRFIRYSYLGEDPGREVRFLKIEGGDHIPYVDANIYDVDCLAEIYDFFTSSRTGVSLEEIEINPMKLFPNPTSNQVQLIADHNMTISILNMSGITLINKEIKKGANTIDVSHLKPGCYILKNNFGKQRKLIIK
jgi:polyhydroxybutyrate depolymerase